jgi:hypothetical protein
MTHFEAESIRREPIAAKRKILFRGKRVDNGEWVEGGFTLSATGAPIITVKGGTADCGVMHGGGEAERLDVSLRP